MTRLVVWFSCGATSAVAAKLALADWQGPSAVVYCDTGGEHPDNVRFMVDVSKWLGHEITTIKNPKYDSIWDVFERERYLAGVKGARCTTEMKKKMRQQFEDLENDVQVFGFDYDEVERAERFKQNNPEVKTMFPLIEYLSTAGIEIPAMYRLGYKNNNCIGCVKGQAGYWNKIRKDFPEVFQRMALLERKLNVAINKSYAGDGKRKRVFLDELDPTAGRYDVEGSLSCGVLCK
jgi:3'-phosphoadenosine 5'-phosphosulfate sulfotransferase (PAPS reductase)/FAD synthetase